MKTSSVSCVEEKTKKKRAGTTLQPCEMAHHLTKELRDIHCTTEHLCYTMRLPQVGQKDRTKETTLDIQKMHVKGQETYGFSVMDIVHRWFLHVSATA
jgi:hypothetical protein